MIAKPSDCARGFTLIEMLVTLALLGLMAGVVFPRMENWYASIVARQALAELGAQLKQFSAVAVSTGRDFALAEIAGDQQNVPAAYRLVLPRGWAWSQVGDLQFLHTGLCQPGDAQLDLGRGRLVAISGNSLCEIELSLQSRT